MALVPKSKVVQVRIDGTELEMFQHACVLLGCKPTARIRALIRADVAEVSRKAASAAAWQARQAIKTAQGGSVPSVPEKLTVAPPVKSVSLFSEKRALDKAAKKALKKKREEKWLK